MQRFYPLKYLFVFILPLMVAISFTQPGWLTFLPLLFGFALVPLLELLITPSKKNIENSSFEIIQKKAVYDYLIYLIVPIQWGFVIWFLMVMKTEMTLMERIGRITGMGIMCGVLGINVAHELGHRVKKYEQIMAKSLLLTSLYMQFFIEHNRGHHKNVGTYLDPTTAKVNEILPLFWWRSIRGVYVNAWKISSKDQKKKSGVPMNLKHEMFRYTLLEIGLLALVLFLFGGMALIGFLGAALMGILLLETVEYIEHYGLMREKLNPHRFENTQPKHSWNSNHQIGRLLLFELSRHSDHHYKTFKKYQTLIHHENSPQMPTGYPGMMLMAMIPPLWFKVMNPKVEESKKLI